MDLEGAEPWLSVVMPTFNGGRFLGAALESIRCQGTGGLEVIAVDDGSTDDTPKILQAMAKVLPLRIIQRRRSGNWVAASNIGLRSAVGRFACFLHQDDLWLPGRLAVLRDEAARVTPPALVLHPARYIGPRGEPLGLWRCPLASQEGEVDRRTFVEQLLIQNFIAVPSPMFDRELAVRLGGLDESLWYAADWDFWLRLGERGPVRYLDAALTAFRIHGESQTAVRASDQDERRGQLRKVLDRHLSWLEGCGADVLPVREVATFSIAANVAMAAAARGEAPPSRDLIRRWLRLGPVGWTRYLRDSRIVERASARILLGLSRPAEAIRAVTRAGAERRVETSRLRTQHRWS